MQLLLSKFTEAVVNVDGLAGALPAFPTRLGPPTGWLSDMLALRHVGSPRGSILILRALSLSLSLLSALPPYPVRLVDAG